LMDGYTVPGGYRSALRRQLAGAEIDFVGSLVNGAPELVDCEHEGHVGYTVGQLAENAAAWLRAAGPDVVLLLIGTNDALIGGEALQSAPLRYRELLSTIQAELPGTAVLAGTLPPIADAGAAARADWLNGEIRTLAAAAQSEGLPVLLVDVGAVLQPANLEDGVHPNAAGYEEIGRAWFQALAPLLR